MYSVLILWGFCAFANANLREIALPIYVPFSQDAIASKYFQPESNEGVSKEKTVAENFYKAIGFMKNDLAKNVTKLRRETFKGNANVSNAVSENLWTSLLKRFLRNSHETTTYRYPTATWTAEHHEKLKKKLKNQPRKIPKPFLTRPSPIAKSEARSKRGKIKWKGLNPRGTSKEEVDKFLQQSLLRYLVSSKLIENIGNVSVETFSEILRNVTRYKADKRQFWPYDENKELRIKFRDEVFMKRKSESPSRGRFLEKQLQKRLERMQDYLKGKFKDKGWKKKNSVEVQDKKTSTTERPAATSTSPTVTTSSEPKNLTETEAQLIKETLKPSSTDRGEKEKNVGKHDSEELKLSVAETVYYKKTPFSLKPLLMDEEEGGVIPGIPRVDYPMYSSPPRTGFRCPDGIGEQPRMMADAQTRCQVFYICTGDGPAAAMLCPNGTMFNENVRVCDWWYNVNC